MIDNNLVMLERLLFSNNINTKKVAIPETFQKEYVEICNTKINKDKLNNFIIDTFVLLEEKRLNNKLENESYLYTYLLDIDNIYLEFQFSLFISPFSYKFVKLIQLNIDDFISKNIELKNDK